MMNSWLHAHIRLADASTSDLYCDLLRFRRSSSINSACDAIVSSTSTACSFLLGSGLRVRHEVAAQRQAPTRAAGAGVDDVEHRRPAQRFLQRAQHRCTRFALELECLVPLRAQPGFGAQTPAPRIRALRVDDPALASRPATPAPANAQADRPLLRPVAAAHSSPPRSCPPPALPRCRSADASRRSRAPRVRRQSYHAGSCDSSNTAPARRNSL